MLQSILILLHDHILLYRKPIRKNGLSPSSKMHVMYVLYNGQISNIFFWLYHAER